MMDDYMEYIEEMLRDAEDGDTEAGKAYALAYLDDLRDEVDEEIKQRILKYITRAANEGDEEALLILGNLYMDNDLFEMDIDKARSAFERASYCGNREISDMALCMLGTLAIAPDLGEDVEAAAAMHYLMRSLLENDSSAAAFLIGDLYSSGIVGEIDDELAYDFYLKAEELLDVAPERMCHPDEVYLRLGRCWLEGSGVETDPYEAIEYLSKAEGAVYRRLQSGDPTAMDILEMITHLKETAKGMIEEDMLDQADQYS